MLVLTRRSDESVDIGDDIVVTVLDIKGSQVVLGFSAPDEVEILRTELKERKARTVAEETASEVM